MAKREFKFSKDSTLRGRKLGSEDIEDGEMRMPIEKRYFTKLPQGMEPQVWIRLKTTVAFYMPPDPKMGVYPMSFDDRYWSLHNVPVTRKDGTQVNMTMLMYNYKTKHDEEGISASLMFNQIVVSNSRSQRGYDVLNLKYDMYDCEISKNVTFRIIPNPI